MPTVLVTGGTGVLGCELAPRLAAAGYTVRIMSRGPRRADADAKAQWAQADLETGEGLAEAVAGADLIIHCATSPMGRTQQTDVRGTELLLQHARASGQPHLFYISIVGIDRVPLGYYKAKLAAEKLVEGSGLPWSILRATQFHTLIDRFLRTLIRLPLALLPTDFKFQPIDPAEVADRMVEFIAGGPSGRLPDLGGPEILSFGDLARAWLKARRRRALLVHLPLPGKTATAFRRGYNCTPENAYGRVTWEQWLRRRYDGSPRP